MVIYNKIYLKQTNKSQYKVLNKIFKRKYIVVYFAHTENTQPGLQMFLLNT